MTEIIEKITQLKPRQIILACVVGLVILFLLEIIPAVHMHSTAWWQKVPGYNVIMGVAIALIWVYSVKWVGKRFLQKPDATVDDEVEVDRG